LQNKQGAAQNALPNIQNVLADMNVMVSLNGLEPVRMQQRIKTGSSQLVPYLTQTLLSMRSMT
jgi:hypothetical protein